MGYRRHTVRFGIGLLWLVPVAVLTPVLDPVYAAICLPFLALSIRTMRIGVFTRPDGVTVRGVLRTWKLRWDEIAAFGPDDRVDELLAGLSAELAARRESRSSDPGSARSAA